MRTILTLVLIAVVGQFLLGCGGAFNAQPPSSDGVMFIRNTTALSVTSPSDKFEPYPLPILQPGARISSDVAPYVLASKSLAGSGITSTPAATAIGTPVLADVSTAPYDRFVKLRFQEGGKNYQCSAEFVGDSLDVLVTAAHCVYSNTINAWSSGWRAYSKYDQGNYETAFNWECVATYSGWAKGNYPRDYAFIKLRGKNLTSLGLRGAALPSEWKSVGYPSNFYSGERLVQVDGTNGGSSGGVVKMANNPFGPGSSGGAWIVGNTAVGLNSFKYNNDPSSMWGPQFDVKTIELYEFVRRGCITDEVAVARSPSPPLDSAVYVEMAGANPNLAPSIVYSVDKSCTCSDSRLVKILNPTRNRYTSTMQTTVFRPNLRSETIQSIHSEILPGESRELGCTVGEPSSGLCEIGQSYSITGLRKIQTSVDASGVRALRSVSPDFCGEKCSDTSSIGYCLPLGSSAKPILTSLGVFVSQTLNNKPAADGQVATVDEMVTTFNGDPKKIGNPCLRSSFFRQQETISNDGLDCRITTAPLDNTPQALRISLSNPTQTRATRSSQGMPTTNAELALFSTRTNAPVIEFAGAANSDELNARYGGAVVAVQKFKSLLVVTTENGCVSGEP